MKIVPLRIASRSASHYSNRHDDHMRRLQNHQRRIRGHACPCGSGLAYSKCCMNRENQELLELQVRKLQGREY